MYKGPRIVKGDGNLNAEGPSAENVMGLVCGGVLPGSGTYTTLGTTEVLTSPTDADTLGFNAAYDANNHILVRHHIDEFFLDNPNGKLYLMVCAQSKTLTNMCDKTQALVAKLIADSGNTVRYVGVVRNPASGYVPVFTGTQIVEDDVLTAIPMAQTLVDDLESRNIFIDGIIVEGRGNPAVQTTFTDMRGLASLNAGAVIAQDPGIAALDALYANYAAVGTALGFLGMRRVEEDMGALVTENNPDKTVETFAIDKYSATTGRWNNVSLSTGELTSTLDPAKVQALLDQGYIFADYYPQFKGIYFSAGAACGSITSDFAFLVNTRVWNYCARIAVAKLTPKFNSKVAIGDDGTIKATTVSAWQEDVNHPTKGLGKVVADGITTKSSVYIDPTQNVQSTSKLTVKMTVRPYGYARDITGELSFEK